MGCVCAYKQKEDDENNELNLNVKTKSNDNNMGNHNTNENLSIDKNIDDLLVFSPRTKDKSVRFTEETSARTDSVADKGSELVKKKSGVTTKRSSTQVIPTTAECSDSSFTQDVKRSVRKAKTIKEKNLKFIIDISYTEDQKINEKDVFYLKVKEGEKFQRRESKIQTTKTAHPFFQKTKVHQDFEKLLNSKMMEFGGNFDKVLSELEQEKGIIFKGKSKSNLKVIPETSEYNNQN